MADVFISYAREDRSMAEALAKDLEARGYSVWWDAALVGSDDFYEVILDALQKAKAALVIWTKASAKSHFVRDEARFALFHKKLVALKEPGLETIEIPFGFQSQHTDDISNREQIIRAIGKLGVVASAARPSSPISRSVWEQIKSKSTVDQVLAFLDTDPPEVERREALVHLKSLLSAPRAAGSGAPAGGAQMMSNLSAFLSGLMLRVPKFQFTTQGVWTSIGLIITYIVIMVLLFAGLIYLLDEVLRIPSQEQGFPAVAGILLIMLFAWWRFRSFAEQRNIAAAVIMAAFHVFLVWMCFVILTEETLTVLTGDRIWSQGTPAVTVATICSCLAVWLAWRRLSSVK